MNPPPKVRSDYHYLCQEQEIFQMLSRMVKPSLWLLLGFLGGVLCNRLLFATHHNTVACMDSTPAYSLQMSAFSTTPGNNSQV
jgi:hypothetical protein